MSEQIPAIALTGLVGIEDRVEALRAGFQSHIPKPVDRTELLLVISNFAGLWRKGASAN